MNYMFIISRFALLDESKVNCQAIGVRKHRSYVILILFYNNQVPNQLLDQSIIQVVSPLSYLKKCKGGIRHFRT
jgi:hypothetical protein